MWGKLEDWLEVYLGGNEIFSSLPPTAHPAGRIETWEVAELEGPRTPEHEAQLWEGSPHWNRWIKIYMYFPSGSSYMAATPTLCRQGLKDSFQQRPTTLKKALETLSVKCSPMKQQSRITLQGNSSSKTTPKYTVIPISILLLRVCVCWTPSLIYPRIIRHLRISSSMTYRDQDK